MEYVNKSNITERDQISPPKKRKSPAREDAFSCAVIGGVSESSSTDQDEYLCKKQREETVVKEKVSRVYYKTEASDTTLVVKDGYQWRKYGQKVTRDNPSPRAYFKCACAPSCSVKKKVQRSVEDQSVLVATYEGEHNHPMPSQIDSNNGLNRHISHGGSASTPVAANRRSSLTVPVTTVDMIESKKVTSPTSRIDFPQVQKLLVEQMASSLTKDPNFTAALAAAVTGKLYQQIKKKNPRSTLTSNLSQLSSSAYGNFHTYTSTRTHIEDSSYIYLHGSVLILFGRYFIRSHYWRYSYAS